MLFIFFVKSKRTITVFLLTEKSASLSNFQGILIRIKGFPAGNGLAQKYFGKSPLWRIEAEE